MICPTICFSEFVSSPHDKDISRETSGKVEMTVRDEKKIIFLTEKLDQARAAKS